MRKITMKLWEDSYNELMKVKKYIEIKQNKKLTNDDVIKYLVNLFYQIEPIAKELLENISSKD